MQYEKNEPAIRFMDGAYFCQFSIVHLRQYGYVQ
ncbi:MAG: hypothetical protein RL329_450 [Bacteroidota bacterium]